MIATMPSRSYMNLIVLSWVLIPFALPFIEIRGNGLLIESDRLESFSEPDASVLCLVSCRSWYMYPSRSWVMRAWCAWCIFSLRDFLFKRKNQDGKKYTMRALKYHPLEIGRGPGGPIGQVKLPRKNRILAPARSCALVCSQCAYRINLFKFSNRYTCTCIHVCKLLLLSKKKLNKKA